MNFWKLRFAWFIVELYKLEQNIFAWNQSRYRFTRENWVFQPIFEVFFSHFVQLLSSFFFSFLFGFFLPSLFFYIYGFNTAMNVISVIINLLLLWDTHSRHTWNKSIISIMQVSIDVPSCDQHQITTFPNDNIPI